LIRASINLQKSLAKMMDCRVKPGNDSSRRSCESSDPSVSAIALIAAP
jgi:hypothetical protein